MNKLDEWFQNHSLRFKMVAMLFAVVLALQVINGLLFTSIVSGTFEENISESNLATVKQMAINLNQAMEDIVNEMIPIRDEVLSRQLLGENAEESSSYVNQSIVYQDMFNRLISADNNYQFINSMLILNDTGTENYSFVLDEYLRLNGDSLFDKILEDNQMTKQCQWGGVLPDSYFFSGEKEDLISIMMPVYRYGKVRSLLIVNLKTEAIRRYLEKLGGTDSLLLLQCNNKDMILGQEERWKDLTKEEQSALMNFQDWAEVENIGENVAMSSELSINQWKLSMITSKSSISSSVKVLTKFMLVIIFTTGIMLLCGVSYIVFIVTKPIKKMTEIMEANRHTRQINHRFHPRYKDEVGVLAKTYNQLMDEIQQLMADIEKEQIQTRKTYVKMLQMQIKPHFLYNTLEAAKFLVEMGDPNGIEMLTTIGRFYKLSLSGINDLVAVREEIEHLTCYLQILKLRYSSKYDYTVDAEEEIMDNEIIKFSLQPLVENAVYHGIKQQRKKGFIKILGYREGDAVVLVVWDNGIGIEKQKLEELQEKLSGGKEAAAAEHIGVINVHQRIRMQYGAPYGLWITSEEGAFTRVEIKLPVKKIQE